VTAIASTSSRVAFASVNARETTGTIDVRCARDAISGTTPPKNPVNVLRKNYQRALRDIVALTLEESGRRLVARCLDAEDSHRLSGLLGKESLDEPAILGRIPISRTDEPLSYHTIASDDHGFGISGGLIFTSHFALLDPWDP
jgi:hypothetical protein